MKTAKSNATSARVAAPRAKVSKSRKKSGAQPRIELALVTGEERRRMIECVAYFRAESRGFMGGNPMQDWLEAEVEVDRELAGKTVS